VERLFFVFQYLFRAEFCSGILVGDQNLVFLASEIEASVEPVVSQTRVNPIRARRTWLGWDYTRCGDVLPPGVCVFVLFLCTGYPFGGRERLYSGILPDSVFISRVDTTLFVSTNILVERGWFDISPSLTLEGRRQIVET